mmetsp:Transcript_11635/g.32311  ORF Transcript_11635/g.32311 Transcript_11635/m.32311 type:complete len:236 (-) Transcript_11635:1419-2126(-)
MGSPRRRVHQVRPAHLLLHRQRGQRGALPQRHGSHVGARRELRRRARVRRAQVLRKIQADAEERRDAIRAEEPIRRRHHPGPPQEEGRVPLPHVRAGHGGLRHAHPRAQDGDARPRRPGVHLRGQLRRHAEHVDAAQVRQRCGRSGGRVGSHMVIRWRGPARGPRRVRGWGHAGRHGRRWVTAGVRFKRPRRLQRASRAIRHAAFHQRTDATLSRRGAEGQGRRIGRGAVGAGCV